ncbi:MAG: HEPN domain-containing protein [Snowella sp.]|nr:HEPN domain-containing protein [Snowella sp.]
MTISQRFRVLEKELKSLRKNFLPRQFDDVGNYYTPRKIALAGAYLVMSHAEIESYFEDRVLDVANNAKRIWDNSQHQQVNLTFACLLAFSGLKLEKTPESLSSQSFKDLGNKFDDSFQAFQNYVRTNNHGIREKNIISLLLPIGIKSSQIDSLWLQEIDNFGKKRGDFAHQSASRYTTSHPPNPKDELKTINRLVYGFDHIDYQSQNSDERLPCLIDIDQLLNNLLNT